MLKKEFVKMDITHHVPNFRKKAFSVSIEQLIPSSEHSSFSSGCCRFPAPPSVRQPQSWWRSRALAAGSIHRRGISGSNGDWTIERALEEGERASFPVCTCHLVTIVKCVASYLVLCYIALPWKTKFLEIKMVILVLLSSAW
ncbi:uncharacterized protein LOC144308368 [Canis aureus]